MRLKNKFLILTFCFIFIHQKSYAQYYFYDDKYYEKVVNFEVGGSFGIMNALTDLGGKKGLGKGFIKDLNLKNTQFAGGIYATATFKNVIGIKLEANFGKIKAYDSILKGDNSEAKTRLLRNLSFKSPINEFSIMVEVHPLMFKSPDIAEDNAVSKFSPYVSAGIGFFSFNPQANLNGTWVNLHPLRTEGQGFPEYPNKKRYQLSDINIPLGVGLRYEWSSLLTARFEITHRILFTDYLDDVSTTYINPSYFNTYLTANQTALALQLHNRSISTDPNFSSEGAIRGDEKDKDAYFTLQLKIGCNIGRQKIK
jgi:hypothetical protein